MTACLGVVSLSFAFDGWLWGPLSMAIRALFLVAGLLLMVPEFYTDLAGAALYALAFASRLPHRRVVGAVPAVAE